MLTLAELQERFGSSLSTRRGWDAYLDLAIDASGRVPPRERLLAYRSNLTGNLRGALALAYPIVATLVGEEYFEGLAREYACAHPSTSGDLAEFGGALPRFLDTFAPARELPYLADVARLDWAIHRAYGSPDEPAFEPARLAGLADEALAKLRPVPAAGARVIGSRHPIHRIWQLHQPGAELPPRLDLDSGGELVLVHRPVRRVEVVPLSPGEAAFLGACAVRATLNEAMCSAADADAGFDLAATLSRFVSAGVIVDFMIGGG